MSKQHIIISGNPIEEFNYCGPFATRSDALDYACAHFDQSNPCLTTMICRENSEGALIVVVGNLVTGMEVIAGMFPDDESAVEYMDTRPFGDDAEWSIAELERPE